MRHRNEIDGLRSLAVLPVVLFHAGYGLFSGGFLGVDMFFVISGYLITAIILREAERGEFSFARFYERRARRILPALFLIVACTAVGAWFVMSASYLHDFLRSVESVLLFVPNVYFWKATDYFAQHAEEVPLLHTWSLGVEEQFYVLFPIILLAIRRWMPKRLFQAVLLIALVSLVMSEWGWRYHPTPNFYLTPPRAWELMIGAMLALPQAAAVVAGVRSARARELLALLGFVLGVAPVFLFDASTPSPSVYMLAPTVGTALMLAFATPETLVGRLLCLPPLVLIGQISYSAYLWHQPLFVLRRLGTASVPSAWEPVALCILTFVLAYASWRWVEVPFRDRARIPRRRLVPMLATAGVALALVGAVGFRPGLPPSRIPFSSALRESFRYTPRHLECFDLPYQGKPAKAWNCVLGVPGGKPVFALVGDSHAMAILPAFDEWAKRNNVTGVFSGIRECAPVVGAVMLRRTPWHQQECLGLNKRMLEYATTSHIPHVFIAGRWSYYTDGDYRGRGVNYIGTSPDDEASQQHSREVLTDLLQKTVHAYTNAGIGVTLVRQLPMQLADPKQIYFKALASPDARETLRRQGVPVAVHAKLQAYADSLFARLVAAGEVSVINLDSALCKAGECAIGTMKESYYADDDHLSEAGARYLSTYLPAPDPAVAAGSDSTTRHTAPVSVAGRHTASAATAPGTAHALLGAGTPR